jgi:septal ring factor EnvC (AmiA/AmiB activator)
MIPAAVLAWALAGGNAAAEPDARQLLGEIEAYDTQIAALDAQLATLEGTLAAAEADRTRLLAEATAAETQLAQRGSGEATLLRGLYRLRRYGLLRVLFGADDAVELRRRSHYLEAVMRAQEARGAEYAELARSRRAAAEAATTANAATAQLRDSLRVQRESLATERSRRESLVREIHQEPALMGRALTETARARREFEGSVMSRESTLPETASAPSTADFRSARGRLPRPVAGRLLRGFGPWVEPSTGARANNTGLDWVADPGTAFRAVFPGVVTRAGYVRGYGQMVMLQHGSFTTLYAHANGLRVVVDQAVKAGDVLGTVGTTGLAEEGAPQLHFEVRYNGTPQDPSEWLAP